MRRKLSRLRDSLLTWPNLVGQLMGRGPSDDSAEPNNGGDGRLDVYLVNARSTDQEGQTAVPRT